VQRRTGRDLYAELLDIVRLAWAGHRAACFTPGEFCYRWHTETSPELPPVARVWREPGGLPAGFAWLSEGQAHLIRVAPDPVLERDMLGWAERRHAREPTSALAVMASDSDTRWQALLAAHGYRPGELALIRRSRGLDTPLAAPTLPDGYTIEDGRGAMDVRHERWAHAYRLAFEPEEMTAALRRAVAAAPLFRAELDLSVRAPDGSLAAFALVWFDEATGAGTFEPVGCVPEHQRQGLSTTLLCEGLRRLRARGATVAYVTAAERRLPANRLYVRAGFGNEVRSRLWRAGR
jgi:ribosomal protein S18 acetylase RimI-like enzyme